MSDFSLILLILLALAIAIIYFSSRKETPSSNESNQQIASNMNNLSNILLKQMNDLNNLVNARLSDNTKVLDRTQRSIGERLDNAGKSYSEVNKRLSLLDEAVKQVKEVGQDISGLHDILRAPKLRGNLGELLLEDLLAQVLPYENYSLQYAFKDGSKVDAVIKLKNSTLVPIDSKFPLENFIKMSASSKEEKAKLKKAFLNDVKKHVTDISKKYIQPIQGTLDFALMYIPAENVYYEIVLKDSSALMNYCLEKHVIPVSPNSFYAYLRTILLGLKGMQIEKKAKEIQAQLINVRNDFINFSDDFEVLGKHLNNASNTYSKSDQRLAKINNNMSFLNDGDLKKKELPKS